MNDCPIQFEGLNLAEAFELPRGSSWLFQINLNESERQFD
jgi:hypothetical protein